jgi:hypothetical protein
MQSSSRSLPFKQSLAGASPATDATLRIKNCECRMTKDRREGVGLMLPHPDWGLAILPEEC